MSNRETLEGDEAIQPAHLAGFDNFRLDRRRWMMQKGMSPSASSAIFLFVKESTVGYCV